MVPCDLSVVNSQLNSTEPNIQRFSDNVRVVILHKPGYLITLRQALVDTLDFLTKWS